MKVALITDTHYGCKKGDKNIHQYFEKFYNNVFFPELKKRKIKSIIHLGDIFDVRKNIDFWSLEWTKSVIVDQLTNQDIHMTVIVGNHDTYYKNTNAVNSPDLLLVEENISIVSEPTTLTFDGTPIFLIPWINKDNYEKTMSRMEDTPAQVAMGHLEIDGFIAHQGHVHQGGMDRSVFKKFKKTFSGHFHHRNDDGKVFYLGNPYQMYWNDYKDVRGFHIFDTDTHELEFIPNPYELFHKVFYNDEKNTYRNYDFSKYEGTIIKLVVESKTNQIQFDEFVTELQKVAIDLKIIEDIEDQEFDSADIDVECEDTLTVLEQFIDEYGTDCNAVSVKDLIRSLYKEAMDMV